MSENKSKEIPIRIENPKINEKTLEFSVINDSNDKCKIYINNELIKESVNKEERISLNISNIYCSRFQIKVENKDQLILKTINRDLNDYFNELKRTLIGKDNTFFLVNDRNNEIRQHYDINFKSDIDIPRFRKSIISKKTYFEKKGIKYGLFVVPDKSITLRDKLPFRTNSPIRNVDALNDVLYDMNDILTEDDRLKNDTHITYKSSLKIVSYMISKLYCNNYEDNYNNLLEHTYFEPKMHYGDLFSNINWSYDRDEVFHENKRIPVVDVQLKEDVEKVELNVIPQEFRYMSIRESLYIKNKHSISEKRAIILHDSTTLFLINALAAYYREVFFYWDHWFFNNELIQWFNPDDVIEIRTERFMEHPQYPIINNNYHLYFPLSAEIKDLHVHERNLNVKLLIKDYRQLPVKTCIKAYIDDKLIKEEESTSLYYELRYDLNDYPDGKYTIRFEIDSLFKHREVCEDFILNDSLEPLFKDLKLTLKGVGDTFFMVNDNTNEVRQHYDKTYKSKFNKKRFIHSFNSKKSFLERLGVNYVPVIIPDKSIVLREYLPFDTDTAHRHVNDLQDCFIDLIDLMDKEDYLINDTRLSADAAIKLVSHIISLIYNENMNEVKKKILSNLIFKEDTLNGNLFTNRSWSYPDKLDLRDKYYTIDIKKAVVKNEFTHLHYNSIPGEFRKFATKRSKYFINNKSITDKKVLILCDDAITPFISSFIAYYKEVFVYEDLWYFNKELVEWFKPDDLLEIRSERTLENTQYQVVSIEDDFIVPINRRISRFLVSNGKLHIKIKYTDLKHLPVNSTCVISVDNEKIDEVNINGLLKRSYDVSDGEHLVEVSLKASKTTKPNVFKKIVGGE